MTLCVGAKVSCSCGWWHDLAVLTIKLWLMLTGLRDLPWLPRCWRQQRNFALACCYLKKFILHQYKQVLINSKNAEFSSPSFLALFILLPGRKFENVCEWASYII